MMCRDQNYCGYYQYLTVIYIDLSTPFICILQNQGFMTMHNLLLSIIATRIVAAVLARHNLIVIFKTDFSL